MWIDRLAPLLLVVVFGLCGRSMAAVQGKVDFNRDIRPLLADHCYQCHGPDQAKRKAGLRLDQSEGARARLESGHHAIVPGQPADSRLLAVVASEDSDERMPPARTGKRLSAAQVEILTRWIREGAEWKPHWAYITPENPEVPSVRDAGWARNPIDSFVLARLEREGLQPSPEADRRTLARRVTLDLTGLPPTVEEVDAFLADTRGDAYEKLVDRLLATEAYGERMAVPWLDLARFADSDGYHADAPRSMWQYRDWVIRAFVRNQPFDQFITDQLAGDLLPGATLDQRIATAFNRNGMSSTEGGADPDEYLNKYVTDRVNTFGTVFLGSSIQCAECHNHKYDPFTQREYYQLYDFFNRIDEKGLDSDPAPPFVKVPTEVQARELESAVAQAKELATRHQQALDVARADWEASQSAWEAEVVRGAGSPAGLVLGPWSQAGPFVESDPGVPFAKEYGPEKGFRAEATFQDGKVGWKPRTDWKDGVVQNLDTAVGATYLHRVLTVDQPRTQPLYFGSDDGIRVWLNGKEVLSKDLSRSVGPNQDEVQAPLVAGENHLLVKIVNKGGACGVYFAADRDAGDPKFLAMPEIARLPVAKRTAEQVVELRRYFRETRLEEVKTLGVQLAAARKRQSDADGAIPTLRIMEDMAKPRASHIRVRGDYRSKGDLVGADVPTSCLPRARYGGSTNRLDLARWLVDPVNPLTARVAVNRFWGLFFPNPLVKTANEFGTNGEPPSHPELLDWLARRFIDDRWDVKVFLKRIAMSATYRQSSHVDAARLARDSENRLLARGPRFRMSAEMLRDNALAVSGLLVRRVGGPSVRPYQPPGLWEEKMFAGNSYQVGQGEELFRRSLYTLWKRTVPNPTLQTFDAPDRALCTVQRQATCTPLQAFVTMNDVTYLEASRVFAQRILRESGDTSSRSRIDRAFRTALARPATVREQEAMGRLVTDLDGLYADNPKAAEELVRVGKSPGIASIPSRELAVWTGLASVILNLDECVTRE